MQKFACVAYEIGKNPPKNEAKIHQIYGKHEIFFTYVYMTFKYGKRFRIAPSFSYSKLSKTNLKEPYHCVQ